MLLPTLPIDIKVEIAEFVTSQSDILNLLVVDSVFLEICRPILYRCAFLLVTAYKANTRHAIKWCKAVLANSHVANCVKELVLGDFERAQNPPRLVRQSLYRLVIKAMGQLKNLRTLRFVWSPPFSYLLLHSTLTFPHLKELQCQGTSHDFYFMKRHSTIQRLSLLPCFIAQPSFNMRLATFLPNLTWCSGPLGFVKRLAYMAQLQRIELQDIEQDHLDELPKLLTGHGETLRYLYIQRGWEPCRWRPGLFEEIAQKVPHLERLCIVLKFTAPYIQALVEDVSRSYTSLSSLRTLILVDSNYKAETWEPELAMLGQLSSRCPDLRLVTFASDHLWHDDPNNAWRYNSAKRIWIPPSTWISWWERKATVLGVSKADYCSVRPDYSGVNGPFFTCHFLN